jgi:hypothetical protein
MPETPFITFLRIHHFFVPKYHANLPHPPSSIKKATARFIDPLPHDLAGRG